MNLKRFTARTARDALHLVKNAFGNDAVVMSTKPTADGVEVLAMAPDGLRHFEALGAAAPRFEAAPPGAPHARIEPRLDASPEQDAQALAMSTLSFQDYVRERMLRRRQVALAGEGAAAVPAPPAAPSAGGAAIPNLADAETARAAEPRPAAAPALPADAIDMAVELRSMRSLIEQRFGALAFMEKLQRHPRIATLTHRLLEAGFSPGLARKMCEGLPAEGDPVAWAQGVLERNLFTGEREPALEDLGGVYAFVGATGVGKTASTAKLAAAFTARHGASNLGLVTLDALRAGAHEQLRAYGRLLGVPVHTAHDRASLDDLLDLLAGKKLVLIDTAGLAPRDARTRELLDMLSHRAVQKLLVVNAGAQGEAIDEAAAAWQAARCRGAVLAKIDEAVRLGPALDALIRHKLKVLAIGNGQRVPEDWHRLSAATLVQRALKAAPTPTWRLDGADVNLVYAGSPDAARSDGQPAHRG